MKLQLLGLALVLSQNSLAADQIIFDAGTSSYLVEHILNAPLKPNGGEVLDKNYLSIYPGAIAELRGRLVIGQRQGSRSAYFRDNNGNWSLISDDWNNINTELFPLFVERLSIMDPDLEDFFPHNSILAEFGSSPDRSYALMTLICKKEDQKIWRCTGDDKKIN